MSTELRSVYPSFAPPADRARAVELPSATELFDALPFATLWLGPDGRVHAANIAAAQCFGRSRAELLGEHLSDLVERAAAIVDAVLPPERLVTRRLHGPEATRGLELRVTRLSGAKRGCLLQAVELAVSAELGDRLRAVEQTVAKLRAELEVASPDPSPTAGPDWSATGLSPRQREIAVALVNGRAPKEIAALLGLSVHTVRTQIKLLYVKLGVRSQLELAAKVTQLRKRG